MATPHSSVRVAGRATTLLALSVFACACAGNGPNTATTGGGTGLAAIQQQIFDQSCTSGSCHNLISRAGNLALVDGVSYSQLVDVPPDNAVALQAGLVRVAPSQPDLSFLLIKLTGPGVGEGSQMPLSAAPLSAAQIDLIRNWIAAGAPEFEGSSPTPTETATATISSTPTATATNTGTATETPTSTVTPTGTLLATATPTITSTATATPTPTSSPTITSTPTFNPDATLANIQAQIFSPTCATQFCHSAATASENLVLAAGAAYSNLVNVQSFESSLLRVAPGDPTKSFLIVKLTGPPLGEGAQMPSGQLPLSAAQIQLIRDWITQGAQP